jgi:hypothetical protein
VVVTHQTVQSRLAILQLFFQQTYHQQIHNEGKYSALHQETNLPEDEWMYWKDKMLIHWSSMLLIPYA